MVSDGEHDPDSVTTRHPENPIRGGGARVRSLSLWLARQAVPLLVGALASAFATSLFKDSLQEEEDKEKRILAEQSRLQRANNLMNQYIATPNRDVGKRAQILGAIDALHGGDDPELASFVKTQEPKVADTLAGILEEKDTVEKEVEALKRALEHKGQSLEEQKLLFEKIKELEKQRTQITTSIAALCPASAPCRCPATPGHECPLCVPCRPCLQPTAPVCPECKCPAKLPVVLKAIPRTDVKRPTPQPSSVAK
jgi:hypothetical protein